MPDPASVSDVVEVLSARYQPTWAQSWDAVGLTCGDPSAPVHKVLLAVDPVAVVAEEAVRWGADLLLTHHPLFLRAVHGVAATTPKGRVLHSLITHGVALFTAHTNADAANPGVSDALADLVGIGQREPLQALPVEPLDKIVTFVPAEQATGLVDALAAAGAGRIGDYERCAWSTQGTGTFTPLPGAHPAIGAVGTASVLSETRVEMVLPRSRRADVLAALRAAHPYEVPAFDVLEQAGWSSERGIGRVGELVEPVRFDVLLDRLSSALPATVVGVRAAGQPDMQVHRVAVCGGSGDDLFDAARTAGADVYVTADLRHHPASESLEHGRPALVDVGHWASEWPWLSAAAALLSADLAARGATVETRVSSTCTDPWTRHVVSGPTRDPRSRS